MLVAQLDDFTRAYIECALWSTNDESNEQGGAPLDANYDIEDIAPETLDKMVADCRQFKVDNLLDLVYYNDQRWTADELGGHDFWLTRNGHGAGFWDRDCLSEEVAERLTEAAQNWGEVYLYVGDDGLIYSD